MSIWTELYRQLRIAESPAQTPAPKPRRNAFGEFEKHLGFRLPPSFRDFASVFGPGEFGAYVRLRAPGFAGNEALDLSECHRFTHEGDDILGEVYGDPERIRRLVFFATSFTGDIFGWDPADVTDERAPEYAIWGLPRHQNALVRVAATFPEFVDGVLRGTVPTDMGYEFGTTEEERREFIPWVRAESDSQVEQGEPE